MGAVNDDELFAEEVRDVVSLLAPYAFGALDGDDRSRVEDALASSELVRTLYPDVAEAAAALDEADPAHVDDDGEPPADLELRVLSAAVRRRAAGWPTVATAAACAAVLAVGSVLVAARDDPLPVPREAVAFAAPAEGVMVLEAELIGHPWGTTLELAVDGVEEGVTYTVSYIDVAGDPVEVGSFIGVADGRIDCHMSAALLRDDLTGVVVRDARGAIVLEAELV